MAYIRLPERYTDDNSSFSFIMRIPQFWPAERETRFFYGASRTKLLISYLPDWILTIALAGIFFAIDSISGYKREFSLQDTSLRHPYAVHERVTTTSLILICFVAPVVLQPIVNFFTIRSWWDLHNGSLGLILSLALAAVITQFSKVTVGRPRPDLIDRCQAPAGSADPTFGLSNFTICTQTDQYILKDGFRSFPSGHSSLSFAGLGFLAFYLAGKLHLFDTRGHAPKAWIAVAPLCGAALVAISRTMDYRHHWHDVVVGSILGLVTAYFSYRQYYPSLSAELSHRPHGPRVQQESDFLPVHHRQPSGEPFRSTNVSHTGVRPYEDEDPLELVDGTVPRNTGNLQAIWKEGSGQEQEQSGRP